MGASKELMIRLKQKQINEEKHYLNDNEIILETLYSYENCDNRA
jgi:hypothetical protein|tara:strand:+ start:218 stop:349 length:132 start_codon:yes stop_codon:yes gene_type:complete